MALCSTQNQWISSAKSNATSLPSSSFASRAVSRSGGSSPAHDPVGGALRAPRDPIRSSPHEGG